MDIKNKIEDQLEYVIGHGNFTFKIFCREDCRRYVEIVVETDEFSKMIKRTKVESTRALAIQNALKYAEEYVKEHPEYTMKDF